MSVKVPIWNLLKTEFTTKMSNIITRLICQILKCYLCINNCTRLSTVLLL